MVSTWPAQRRGAVRTRPSAALACTREVRYTASTVGTHGHAARVVGSLRRANTHTARVPLRGGLPAWPPSVCWAQNTAKISLWTTFPLTPTCPYGNGNGYGTYPLADTFWSKFF